MVDFSSVRAIDFHTHAERPCGCHADDGYDELQTTMAKYFGAPGAIRRRSRRPRRTTARRTSPR